MFRATVRLNERANVAKEAEALRTSAERSGLNPAAARLLAASFAEVLTPLVENGRKLKVQGSQLEVTRKFEDKGYSVTLRFGANKRPGLFVRLWQLVRRR